MVSTSPPVSETLIFIKLGGSLITDKRRAYVARRGALRLLAEELRDALDAAPGLRVVLGHGSGSFGHWEASQYGTRKGVQTPEQWEGFARVSAAAARLNRIVTDAFLDFDVPVISFQPSASALATSGHPATLALEPIRRALASGLVPLVFGDVAFDRVWGGTILSTEDLFAYLAPILHPQAILLLGNAPGVLDDQHQVIPAITPENYAGVEPYLRGAAGVDVTGGMADKVEQMIQLVKTIPDLKVRILTGRESGNLRNALLDPAFAQGTLILNG
ncbi:MAG: isopentenyl phosphate kinase family protein [Anaerolineae bacterium]|nr:isopentenyl phosphate kinase family protein [Anaerolineae bacterium]